MSIRNIRRQATNPLAAPGTPTSAPIYVDSDDNILKMIPAGSGTTEVQVIDASSSQTLTSKTLTSPTITSPTITGTNSSETKFATTQFDAVTGTTGTTFTNVVGFTGFNLTAAGVYKFEVHIAGVSTANCGIKLAFKYTTATLTDMEAVGKGFTAAAVAVQHTTTATDQAPLFAQTAAVINVTISGRITVNAAGTLAVQAAQNAAHADTTSVFVGSWATFTRIS